MATIQEMDEARAEARSQTGMALSAEVERHVVGNEVEEVDGTYYVMDDGEPERKVKPYHEDRDLTMALAAERAANIDFTEGPGHLRMDLHGNVTDVDVVYCRLWDGPDYMGDEDLLGKGYGHNDAAALCRALLDLAMPR